MSRRPQGTGSIYQRGDGYWVASFTIAGQRVNKYCKTQREAQDHLAQMLVNWRNGTLATPNDTTLGEWIDQWLELNQQRLRPSTLRTYRQVLTPVSEIAGKTRLDKLTPLQLSAVFTRLQKQGRGSRRIQLAHTYLRTCLAEAVSLDILSVNPMVRVRKPSWTPAEKTYWTIAEAQRFIETGLASGGRHSPLFVFLTTTGLRISEALGLTWAEVDLKNRVVHIRRACVWSAEEYSIMPTKTKSGRRDVTLTQSAVTALLRLPASLNQDVFVFRSATGNPPRPTDLRNYLKNLCNVASVPNINVHGLRHVAAMVALEATQDIYLVQRRLGHSQVSTTLGIYGYPSRSESVVAAAVDELLASKN